MRTWGVRLGAWVACAMLVVVSSLTLGAQSRRFFADDPIWREPITQDVKNAVRYEPDLAYQTIENLFWKPGDPVLGQRAKNVNTVDEVPDGPCILALAVPAIGGDAVPSQPIVYPLAP